MRQLVHLCRSGFCLGAGTVRHPDRLVLAGDQTLTMVFPLQFLRAVLMFYALRA
jgi:hypothetical protein